MPTRACLAVSGLLAAGAASAGWHGEHTASRLDFVARFMGDAVPGRFTDFDVALSGEAAAGAQLVVSVRTAGAVFDSAEVTAAVRDAAWFDVAQFPEARYEAALEARGGGRFLAHGTLALKGVQRALEIPITWREQADGAHLVGEFAVERGWFGIGTGSFEATDEVAAEVRVSFDVRLRRDE
ncbi:MAG: YceI family protein [Gammaproteobacteria bacterium]|nr:YceI family protein [Gammaproteobacteria bacterium]